MNNQEITKQHYHFINARKNLLLMAMISLVNLVLVASNSSMYLLFSAFFPQFSYSIGSGVAQGLNNNMYLVVGLVVACTSILCYLVCWYFSDKKRWFMLVALILFSFDSLLFLFFALSEFDTSYLIDIAFQVWIMYYLIIGTAAWSRLKKLSNDEILSAINAVNNPQVQAPEVSELPENNGEETQNSQTNEEALEDDKTDSSNLEEV